MIALKDFYGKKTCWIDLETTTLKPSLGAIIEVAILAVDEELNIYDQAETLVDPYGQISSSEYSNLHAHMKKNKTLQIHTDNNLLKDIQDPKNLTALMPISKVNDFLKTFIKKNGLERAYLGGASVHFDRAWLNYHGSYESMEIISHRNIDTNSVFEFLRYIGQPMPTHVYDESLGKPHRALSDIINTLSSFRDAVEFGRTLILS